MPTLTEKLVSLERTVAVASRTLDFWRQAIDAHGEKKTEAFYLHLGLNHIEKKQFEWEGLSLSREPTEIEKLCIKSIASAQDSSQANIKAILLDLRGALIDDGLKEIKKLDPADYHTLVLDAPEDVSNELRDQVTNVFMKGKRLVASELNSQKSDIKQSEPDEEDDAELDDLTDVTESRTINDVQSRITASAARYVLLGLAGAELWKAVRGEVEAGSVSYIDRTATGLANKVLNFGRSREADDQKDDWDRVEYSAILDQNTCGPCAADDGQTATDESDLTDVPNPDCEGGDWCRCFHVWIAA